MAEIHPEDDHLSPDGRVMEVLSEHQCQGWLEGYLLTGPPRLLQLLRGLHPHHRLDVQPARQVAEGVQRTSRGGGRSRRSTTCLSSHVWRQDHNGFSHQDPGFIDHVVNKKAEVIRVYLPPDANYAARRHRSLPAQPQLRQRRRRRQAAGAAVAHDGPGDQALRGGHRHLGMGQQRPGQRAGRRDGVLRRRADAGDARGRRAAARSICPSSRSA